MTVNSYEEAMDDALDRLRAVGFEQVSGFPSHASMAAEAFAALGYYDQVADWVEWNKHHRAYTDEPVPTNLILADDEDAWRPALGVTGRAADWSAMFEREIAEHGWREVLATWWPRLLPGAIGGLTHGLIRTAHAVRGVTRAQPPSALQLRELAHGLGLWAAVFTTLTPSSDRPEQNEDGPLTPEGVQGALSDLTSANAGIYTASRSPNPVPLVHVITAPAAVRLVLPSVPTHLHEVSYRTIAQVTQTLIARFAAPLLSSDVPLPGPGAGELTLEILKAEAAELGDEHVIKLAEAADREYSLRPDPRYLRASWALNQRMKGSPPESRFGGRQL